MFPTWGHHRKFAVGSAAGWRTARKPSGGFIFAVPQYAAYQQAVKGLLVVASDSADAFTAEVARALLERFFRSER